jgi:hypothetical protein
MAPAGIEFAEKPKFVIPFTVNRGTPRAEESLFSLCLKKERFLASLGMTP